MSPPSTRICKRRAPQRQKPDPQLNLPVALRRSTRLQPKQRSISMPQSLLKHRSTASQTPYTRLPTSDPINAPVPSRIGHNYTHKTRKRGLDGSIENSFQRPSKRPRLTVKNLKKLEEMGKPGEKGSTGNPRRSKSSGSHHKSSEIRSTRSKQTTSTTESGFQDIAFDNGILNPENSRTPSNLQQLEGQINQTRDTASPSESEYENFAHKIRTAPNEQTVLIQTSKLLKEYGTDDSRYSKVFNYPFVAFPENVGFNTGLSAAQPDMVEGLEMPEFERFPVRQQLGGAAVPTPGTNAISLSHFAGEWKGPGKDMIEAQTQAAYDGACMVYSRDKARSFMRSPDPTGYAYVHSFTTDGTTVNTFAHYSTQDQDQVKYHQYPTSTSLLRSSYEDFKIARRRLRNNQGIAKENSETLRDELIDKWPANQQYIEDDEEEDEEEEEEEDDDDGDGDFSPPVSQGIQTKTADHQNCDCYDQEGGEEEASTQLLTEYYSSFAKDEDWDEDAFFVQIPTPDASSLASKPQSRPKKKKARHSREST